MPLGVSICPVSKSLSYLLRASLSITLDVNFDLNMICGGSRDSMDPDRRPSLCKRQSQLVLQPPTRSYGSPFCRTTSQRCLRNKRTRNSKTNVITIATSEMRCDLPFLRRFHHYRYAISLFSFMILLLQHVQDVLHRAYSCTWTSNVLVKMLRNPIFYDLTRSSAHVPK